jgi:hypothetical protein
MVKKFLIVRLQNPEMVLPLGKKVNFVVGQEVKVLDSEEEAIAEINEIMDGPDSTYLLENMPSDFGFTIIPYYTEK